jgi:hypothetical protein
MKWPKKYLETLISFKAKKLITLKRIGPRMKQSYYSGQFPNIAPKKILPRKDSIKMIGLI